MMMTSHKREWTNNLRTENKTMVGVTTKQQVT